MCHEIRHMGDRCVVTSVDWGNQLGIFRSCKTSGRRAFRIKYPSIESNHSWIAILIRRSEHISITLQLATYL